MALYYDYAFIGLGASNCLLIKQLFDSGLLQQANVAVIEPDAKNNNDRTFCFWATSDEVKHLQLQNLVSCSWRKIAVSGAPAQDITPMQYYHIAGIDLYNDAKACLEKANVSFYKESYVGIPGFFDAFAEVILNDTKLLCKRVFDCRPPVFAAPKKHQAELKQSFYGLKVTTDKPVFDVEVVTMMDFNVPQHGGTQFIYILPHSATEALVELTRFATDVVSDTAAHGIVAAYLQQLQTTYTINDIERAVIPMHASALETQNFNTQWIAMGKQAGLLKPSTGYAFHAMAEHACAIANGIKNNNEVTINKKQRFVFYDRLLLNILKYQPEMGKPIFETLFAKVPAGNVLHFLKEKTNVAQEAKIFLTLPKLLFLKYAVKDVAQNMMQMQRYLKPLLIGCIFLLGSVVNIAPILWPILVVGFLGVGLPHGALDYLEDAKTESTNGLLAFVSTYVLKAILVGVSWYFLPNATLLFFIIFSAWHFGQADFFAFKVPQLFTTFIWGLLVLLLVFVTHLQETSNIMLLVNANTVANIVAGLQKIPIVVLLSPFLIAAMLFSVLYKRLQFLLTFFYLAASYYVPILLAFGSYFIFEHSMHGWQFLQHTYKKTSGQLFKKAMPFTIAAIVMALGLYLYVNNLEKFIAVFFVFIACISLPHVLSMHRLYKN
jgi:lycopene beta-cyclase